ncbi:MAG: metallophosphoesterase [Rikenellaceae bacterium]
MKKIFTFIFLFLGLSLFAQNKIDLEFIDGKFKIVQFTDLHYITNDKNSKASLETIKNTLLLEQPYLVVFTGDIVDCTDSQKGWEEVLKPVIEAKIPFVVTFGTHDDRGSMTKSQIYDFITSMPYNVNGTIPEGVYGTTNHALEIKNSDGTTKSICWIFDSNSYSTLNQVGGFGWIEDSQIQWYSQKSKEFTAINNGTPMPSVAFFHKPLPEHKLAYDNSEGINVGTRGEAECAPNLNSGLFFEIVKNGDIMSIFVGHDHKNDYVAKYQNILLGYGCFTGNKNTLSSKDSGARVIVLKENTREINTWIIDNSKTRKDYIDYPRDYSRGGLYYKSDDIKMTSYALGAHLGNQLVNSSINKDELNWGELIAGMQDALRDETAIGEALIDDIISPYFLGLEVENANEIKRLELELELEKERQKGVVAEQKQARKLARQEAIYPYLGLLAVGVNETAKALEKEYDYPDLTEADNDKILNMILNEDPTIKQTPKGNYFSIIERGSTYKPSKYSTIAIEYEERLFNGRIIKSSKNSKSKESEKPVVVNLKEMLPGVAEAMTYIGIGGHVHIWIPSKNVTERYIYTNKIPPGSAIYYDIKLVSIIER